MLQVSTLTCTIANGQSLSNTAQPQSAPYASLGDMALYGIIMPSSWTAANLTLQLSSDGTNFSNVYDSGGSEFIIYADASRHILIPPAAFICSRGIKVRSGTSGTPVNQGAARDITLLVRYFA